MTIGFRRSRRVKLPGWRRWALQKIRSAAIFSNRAGCHGGGWNVIVAWGAKVTDLQTKVQVYETKAARCEERARQASEGHQRAFYAELANYYGAVATDFRQGNEKT